MRGRQYQAVVLIYVWSHIISFLRTPQLSSQWRGWCGVPRPLVHRAGQTAPSLLDCRWVAPRTGRPCLWAAAPVCLPYCARSHSQNTQRDLEKHETCYCIDSKLKSTQGSREKCQHMGYKRLWNVECFHVLFSKNQCICVTKPHRQTAITAFMLQFLYLLDLSVIH